MVSFQLSKLKALFTVDVRMLPSKISFLLYGGLLGSYVPFLNVFLTSVGLSVSQAGLISGLRFAPSAIAGPLWGIFGDYSGRRKLILILLCLGAAIPMFSMPWVSRAIYPDPKDCTHYNATGVTKNDSLSNGLYSHIASNNVDCLHQHTKKETLFYVLLAIMLFNAIFLGPLPGYIEAIVANVCKTGKREASFGVQRLFASLGFTLASFAGGVVADNYKKPHMSRYTAVFCLFLPFVLLLIPIGCYLVGQTRWGDNNDDRTAKEERQDKGNTKREGMASKLFYMFQQFEVVFFMLTVLVSGLAINILVNFALMLANDVIIASQTEKSLIFVVATIAEVAIFPFTTKLLKLLDGTAIAMTLGILSYFIRFLVMSYTTQLWLMVFIQVLHSVGFALTWAAMMEHVYEITPKEIVLTMFLVLQSIMFGVSALIANIAGGYLYQLYGGQKLFRATGIMCGVWTVFMILYYAGKFIRGKYFEKVDASVQRYSNFRNEKLRDLEIYQTKAEYFDFGVDNIARDICEEEVTVHVGYGSCIE